MFDHILTREREVFWQYGEVTCAAFSLKDLDSVSRFYPTIRFIFLCASSARLKKLGIRFPSELVNFRFHFPPLKLMLLLMWQLVWQSEDNKSMLRFLTNPLGGTLYIPGWGGAARPLIP